MTPGFRLPARYVIHTVGPVWHGGNEGERRLLASCYRSVLEACAMHEIRSLAIPAISCGVFGFPVEEAARIAVSELEMAIERKAPIDSILLVSFGRDVHDALTTAVARANKV